MLGPLNILTYIKRKFKWIQVKKYSFNEIKRIVAHDTLLIYTDFNEVFKIRIDASTFRLGVIIVYKGKPVAFHSGKLTVVQQRYKVTERELISIVENLEDFRTILLG